MAACTRDGLVPTSTRQQALGVAAPEASGEGELLGDLSGNNIPITDTGYTVRLEAANAETSERLHYYNASMWVSPTGHGLGKNQGHMFAWIDPRHQGGCGNEHDYVSADTAARDPEFHWQSPTTPPSGFEEHCIQPGQYWLKLYHNGSLYKQFEVDYVPTMTGGGSVLHVYNATAGIYESIEKQNLDDTTYVPHDLDIRIDVGSPAYSHTPVLYADAAVTNPYADTTFTDLSYLSGTHHTWFRFSSVASTTNEPPGIQGGLLSRMYWDSAGDLSSRTGFWDSYSPGGIIRVHQFMTDTLATRDYVVGLEVLLPDEQPRTTPEVTRIVHIQGPPPPPPALTADIQGPTQVWNSGESEVPVGTDAGSYTRYITVEPTGYVVWIRVVVTDAAEQAAGDTQLVEVGGGAHPLRPNCS